MTIKSLKKRIREWLNDADDAAGLNYSPPTHRTISIFPTTSDKHYNHTTRATSENMGNFLTGSDARDALMRGVNAVADAVKGTLGAGGYNAVLESDLRPGHLITNDGVSIAREIVMTDPYENMGANLMKEVATRADKESGDGTTTAITLAQAILKEGLTIDASPMEIKRSLDECLPIILKSLDDQKREITVNEVGTVASISAEDETLGALFQEIYTKIGKDGIIELDNSNTYETFYEIKEGVRLRDTGLLSPYMATEGTRAVYHKPRIIIATQKIAALSDINNLYSSLEKEGIKEVVILAQEIEQSVLAALAFTQSRGIFKTLIIKAPVLFRDWIFEDFAAITGATIIGPETGVTWKTVTLAHLGSCDKIVVGKEETTVLGIKDISKHLTKLEELVKEDEQIKVRIAWLKTKAAVLKLGANSESELSYKRLKAEDARNASYLALQDGIVAGGGLALVNASYTMPNTVGGTLLRQALTFPLEQIMSNAGFKTNWTLFKDNERGFDAKAGKMAHMFDAGIVDPCRVVKNSVKNAISVAGVVLTAQVVVTKPKKEEERERMPIL